MQEKIITLEELEEELVTFEEDKDEELVTFEEDIIGTNDYEKLLNIPLINEVSVIGSKTSKDYKLQDEMQALSNIELENLLK